MAQKKKKGEQPKKTKKQARIAKNSTGKNTKSQKNSASKPVSTSSKQRTYRTLPKGYRVTKNAKVVDGKVQIHNGKPLFATNKQGQKQIATDRYGNPAHKKALLIVEPKKGKQHHNEKPKQKAPQKSKSATNQTVTIIIKTHDDKKGGHPHVIIEDIDDKHVSVGLTSTAHKGKGHKNIKLQSNPLGGSKPSYMKRQGTVDNKQIYYGERSGVMTKTDHAKAKQIGNRAKQKHLNDKNKKKKP